MRKQCLLVATPAIAAAAILSASCQESVKLEFPADESWPEVTCKGSDEDGRYYPPAPFHEFHGNQVVSGKKLVAYHDVIQWRGDRRTLTFVGTGDFDQTGNLWIGTLNNKKAAGYSLNRHHQIFSTEPPELTIECWQRGYEHGEF